jgi:RHS repeat-associated protein
MGALWTLLDFALSLYLLVLVAWMVLDWVAAVADTPPWARRARRRRLHADAIRLRRPIHRRRERPAYLRARYYDPATGQFLSRDPALSLSGSVYAYADGDPIGRKDPSGLWTGGICRAFGLMPCPP